MLETTRQNYKMIAIFVALVAAGIPLLTHSSGRINFMDYWFLAGWLASGVVGAFFTLLIANLKTRDLIGSFTIGYASALIVYFVSRILLANMIHSQFILSLGIAILFGIISGWTGSLIWTLIKKKN